MPPSAPLTIGRYALHDKIASGGMATVYLGRLAGDAGFSRTVAIKRLHPQYAADPDFAAMFVDEARLAARVRHPNVITTLDVVAHGEELFLVMEYVEGESLAQLARLSQAKGERIPNEIIASVVCGVLHGLHAAHEAKSESGVPLDIVHRDVSPQNVLVGIDGAPRVIDFGVAKAIGQLHTTREGQVKGKLAYLAPEQIMGGTLTRQVDVFAAGVMVWELLTGSRLFAGGNEGEVLGRVLHHVVEPPSRFTPDVPPALDAVVLRALERDPSARFATTEAMATAIEDAVPLATPRRVGEWVKSVARDRIAKRADLVGEVERSSSATADPRAVARAREATPSLDPTQLSSVDATRSRARVGAVVAVSVVVAIGSLIALGFALRHGPTSNGAASAAASPGIPHVAVESATTTVAAPPSVAVPPPSSTALASATATAGTRPPKVPPVKSATAKPPGSASIYSRE